MSTTLTKPRKALGGLCDGCSQHNLRLTPNGPHGLICPLCDGTERLITLLAWLDIATNPVEHDRYWRLIGELRRQHPVLTDITEADPRVETRAMELRAESEADDRLGEYDDVGESRMGWR